MAAQAATPHAHIAHTPRHCVADSASASRGWSLMRSGGVERECARERVGDVELTSQRLGERGGTKEVTDLLLWDSATAYCQVLATRSPQKTENWTKCETKRGFMEISCNFAEANAWII
ncbi:hypothetical protein Q8A73_019714 [Channa argus]|nr:hypothetical protein Q8A73_019714 [Channa argus]